MGYYNVVAPCVVGKRHHVRPTEQPIEVDDTEATPLVEQGCLVPYLPGGVRTPAVKDAAGEAGRGASEDFVAALTDHEGTAVGDPDQDPLPTGDLAPAEADAEEPKPRRSRRRATTSED